MDGKVCLCIMQHVCDSFHMNYCISAARHGCWGAKKAKAGLTLIFILLALLTLLSHVYTIVSLWGLSQTSVWSKLHSDTIGIIPNGQNGFGAFSNVGRYQILLENEIRITMKQCFSNFFRFGTTWQAFTFEIWNCPHNNTQSIEPEMKIFVS